MSDPEILPALTRVADTLERLGVPYHIGGSVASSVYGAARATVDVDLVAELPLEHVEQRPYACHAARPERWRSKSRS